MRTQVWILSTHIKLGMVMHICNPALRETKHRFAEELIGQSSQNGGVLVSFIYQCESSGKEII